MNTFNRDQWINDLYEDNYLRLYRLALSRLRTGSGRIENVEDVIQEVFCRAIKHQIWNHPNPVGWLIIATNNVCLETNKEYMKQVERQGKLQKKVKAEKPKGIYTMYESAISPDSDVSDLYLTLEQSLSKEDMELLNDYCIEGKEIDEISRQSGLSVNHIRVKIHRIRKLLQSILNSIIGMMIK